VNKSDLIARMTERLSGDRTTAAAAVNGVLAEIEGSVARGERVSLSGFGTFDRRERAPRIGRNPRTGEAIRVGPSMVPVFRAGTGFRTLLAQPDGVAKSTGSAAVEGSVPKANGEKPRSAPSAGGTAVIAEDAAADGKKKAGKKARDKADEKGSKKARKAAKNEAGKKAAKKTR
jgi:DNA-binding protein HU-beta